MISFKQAGAEQMMMIETVLLVRVTILSDGFSSFKRLIKRVGRQTMLVSAARAGLLGLWNNRASR